MITFLDFTKFAWEHRSTSIKLEDLYVNPGKSYIYILVPQSGIKKMLNGEDFYGKVGVTKNEPYNRFKDIDKQLIATTTGKPEYAYCLCVFEIDFKDQADKAVHVVLEKLGCIKSKNDIQYSTSVFGEKPGDDWFINLSFNKIIKSIDTVYKNNKKYFVSDDININGVIDYKMPEVYNNNTIIRKMIENIKSDKDDNIVELIYVGFVMSYIKYKNNELSGKTFNEIIDSTILSKHIDKIINSIKNDKFVDNINIKNIISEDLYSKYAELYNKITSIYNNVSNSVTSRLNTLLSGLNKDIFNTDITTFITLLYTDFKFKQRVNKLNIKYTSKIMEYRMTFDLFEYIINEMSRSYNGAKDANFYKTAINNITIFVDSDFMAEMWRTLIHSEYGIYNIIDSINIVNIASDEKKLKNYMEENKKKFNVCLMNPPYSDEGRGHMHLDFVNHALTHSNAVIAVFPCNFVKDHKAKHGKTYKEYFSKRLISVEEINSSIFNGTAMYSVGIYNFGENETDEIYFNFNEKSCTCKSILDYNPFNDNDNEILSYISNNPVNAIWAGGVGNTYRKSENDYNKRIQLIEEHCIQLPNDKVYLVANFALGGNTARFFTKNTGKIFTDKQILIEYFKSLNCTNGYNVLIFDDVIFAERCRDAMNRPLFRAMLSKLQVDQSMPISKCYTHIPNIDWEDDRVKTDEGILEMCGCPKDKYKEYVDYCRKIIEEIDKK